MIGVAAVPWLYNAAKKEVKKDNLKTADMIGDLVAIVAIAIVIIYFVNSQISNSGFFTEKFGGLEVFLFYGVAVSGFFPPALRLILRKRNVVRPVEIANSVFGIVSIIYFLNVFPFDFTHLATPLPSFFQTALGWLTDDIGRVLMTAGVLLATIVTAWTFLIYLAVKRVLQEQTSASPLKR